MIETQTELQVVRTEFRERCAAFLGGKLSGKLDLQVGQLVVDHKKPNFSALVRRYKTKTGCTDYHLARTQR